MLDAIHHFNIGKCNLNSKGKKRNKRQLDGQSLAGIIKTIISMNFSADKMIIDLNYKIIKKALKCEPLQAITKYGSIVIVYYLTG